MSAYPIVYFEISAQDPARSAKFYTELFGWKIAVDPKMGYHQFTAAGGPNGGFPNVDGKAYKPGDIVPYLAADDIDAMLKKIVASGGQVLQPKTEIPGEGWYAWFTDPSGNRMGLFKQLVKS